MIQPTGQAREYPARSFHRLLIPWGVLAAVLLLPLPATAAPVCAGEGELEFFDAGSVVEGDSGRRDAVFRLRLTAEPSSPVSPSPPVCRVEVTYGTLADRGSASAGTDYLPRGGKVTLRGDDPEAAVRVPILGDTLDEADEDFFLAIRYSDGGRVPRELTDTARAVIIDDDELAPAEIEVVGDVTLTARVDQVVPLAVLVRRADGSTVAGATVDWRLVEGHGVLDPTGAAGPAATSVSGSDGVARQRLATTGRPGVVRVVASLPDTGRAVRITVNTEGDLGSLFPERFSGPASVADTLDAICRSAQGEMGALCDYLFDLDDGEQRAVVIAATPRQAAAAGNLALHAGQNQNDALHDRLRARRARAGSGDGMDGEAASEPTSMVDARLAGLGGSHPGLDLRLADLRSSLARHADEEAAVGERIARAVDLAGERLAAEGSGQEPAESTPQAANPDTAYGVDPPSPVGLFLSGRVSSGDRETTFDEAGFEVDVLGLSAGLDVLLGSGGLLGVAAGYLDTDASFHDQAGELSGESWSLSAYGTVFRDDAYLELVLTAGRNDFLQTRGIDLATPFAGASRYLASAEVEGDQWGATLTAGCDRSFGALNVEGFARGSWVEASFDGYEERGAGPFDLGIAEHEAESLLGEAGVQLSWAASFGWGVLQPLLRASYLHEFEDDVRLIRGRFVEDVQALEFVVPTEQRDADFGNAGAGLTATFAGGRSIYVFYDRDLERDGLEMETLSFGLRLEL